MLGCILCFAIHLGLYGQDVFVCGWDEVQAVRIEGTNLWVMWRWRASESDLPEWTWQSFATTDECKPYSDGRLIITSSGGESLNGGVAVVQIPTGKTVFYARAPNAHSADLLPGDRVAVALSYQSNGNRLVIFDLSKPDAEIFSTELQGGHGVVWDEQRRLLWALADYEIRAYVLGDWETVNPRLRVVYRQRLPGEGGHDLYPVPDSSELLVTTVLNCWLFDRDGRTFRKHPLLGDVRNVKSVSVHPATGQIVYVRGEVQWWSERLYFLNPEKLIFVPGQRFYKARWIPPPKLKIEYRTNAVILRWSLLSLGFELQEAKQLEDGLWEVVAGPYDSSFGDWCKCYLICDEKRFFRLQPVLR